MKRGDTSLMNRLPRLLAGMLTVLLVLSLTVVGAWAAEPVRRHVRIGYNVSDTHYFYEDAAGTKSGYYYEFMEELAKFAGWECEYVPLGSWDECLEAVRNGSIDLLAPVKYSAERAEHIYYPATNMGKSFTALVIPNDSPLVGDAEQSINGIRLGTMTSDLNTEHFREFAEQQGIEYTVHEYETVEERLAGLRAGEVDAVALSSVVGFEGYRIIAKFAMEPYYCVTSRDKIVLQQELTKALSDLDIRNPAFVQELYARYYSEDVVYQSFLTDAEREYIKAKGTIRAVITPDAKPISYMENGEFKGIVADVMSSIAKSLGVTFEYINPSSYEQALEMVRAGKVDILCDFGGDYNWAEQNDLIFTTSYVDNMYNMVCRKSVPGVGNTIGLVKGFYVNNTVEQLYPKAQFVYYDTEAQAVKALQNYDVDSICISTFIAESIMPRHYSKFDSFTIKNYNSHLSIAMARNADLRLYNILDKQVNVIKSTEMDGIIANNTRRDDYKLSFVDIIYRNPIAAINTVLVIFIAITGLLLYILYSRKEHNDHVFEIAYTDNLTGTWNSAYLEEKMPGILQRNPHRLFAMVSLDISKFTAINESHGRAMGDKVIRFVAEQLGRHGFEASMVARVKADHFLLLIDYTTQEEFTRILTTIREDTRIFVDGDITIRLILNIGIYLLRYGETAVTSIIDMAEMARRETKNGIVKTVYFDQKLENRLKREKEIEDCMMRALRGGEFEIYYQPKYNIFSNKICGAEALIRWNSPQMGFLNPGEFIPLFENNGFIIELDAFVLEGVFALQQRLLDEGSELIPISINQSRMNFGDESYIERLRTMYSHYSLPKDVIELEITETAFASQMSVETSCRAIKELGYRLSVDDYGSEYSSPTMLREASLDVLKIDRGLLQETELSERGRIIVRKTVELAHELGMEVICEGVEMIEQVNFLKSVGCMLAQGYFYARPMVEKDFLALLYADSTQS